jgi:hypothetical protein
MISPVWRARNQLALNSLPIMLAVCAGIAMWIDFGTLHRHYNGDALIPTLVSLYRWTPFYWGQDRLGMLLPLLAVPLRNPLTNLLVQMGLSTFAALVSLCLLARYTLPWGLWQLAALLSAAGFLALAPEWIRFEILAVHQPYGLSLALALGGLSLLAHSHGWLSRQRVALALILLLLAHWVNISIVLLGPLLVLLRWRVQAAGVATPLAPAERPHASLWLRLGKRFTELVPSDVRRELILLTIAAATSVVLQHFAVSDRTSMRLTSPQEWPIAWFRSAASTWHTFTSREWLVFQLTTPLAAAALLIGLPRLREAARPALRAGLILTLVALLYACGIASTEHAQRNDYAYRYLIPSILLLQTASAAVTVAPLGAVLQRQAWSARWLTLAGMVGLWATAIIGFGLPSLTGVRQDLDWQRGQRTTELLAANCTHIAGNYWDVWPAMFHANLLLYERGETRVLWGLSDRSLATKALWSQIPLEKVRVGVPLHNKEADKEADGYLKAYQFPAMVEVERYRTIVVLQPASSLLRHAVHE